MTATISFPVFRRTHRRSLTDLLEDSVTVGLARSGELVDTLRRPAR